MNKQEFLARLEKSLDGVSRIRLYLADGPDAPEEIPYAGAKPMLAADVDDPQGCCRLVEAVALDLGSGKQGQ